MPSILLKGRPRYQTSAVNTVQLVSRQNSATELKMAVSENFNILYQTVRQLGLPYEIKESSGSVLIKISADLKTSFSKEKFRFHTKRTMNGSNNLNWRSPNNYHEKSNFSSPSFPNIQFFRTTPPPTPPTPRSCSSPPKSSPGPSPSTAVKVPNQTYQETNSTSTPINPYRCKKRIVFFPKTPNLLTPSCQAITTDTLLSSSSKDPTVLTVNDPPSVENSSIERKPPEYENVSPENVAFIKCMKSIYEGSMKY